LKVENRNLSRSRIIERKIFTTRIMAGILRACRNYADKEGFLEVPAPCLSNGWLGACENLETVFSVRYARHRTYLRQSGQLYLETYLPYEEKVWCSGPSFRAEKLDDRHLQEFQLFEMEFIGDFNQLLVSIEDLILMIISEVVRQKDKELTYLGVDIERLQSIKKPFPRITYKKAIDTLGSKWGMDIGRTQERALVELFGGLPLFITHFPEEMKFFNMRTNREDLSVVNSADLILPFSGEAVGAAEREFEHNAVLKKLQKSAMYERMMRKGGRLKDFSLYLDHLNKNGSVLHSGYGVGLERVLQFILGSDDIHSVIPFEFCPKDVETAKEQ
jgi:asparaginyl-tRNA synthetase